MARIKVLVVDDSALMRELLSTLLGADPALEVVGSAADPLQAWDKIKALRPHVVTLDVEMPRMDGLTFLDKLMTAFPLPVVMVSSLTEKGCETTLRALELGAIDFVSKPKLDLTAQATLTMLGSELCSKVKIAAQARTGRRAPTARPPATAAGRAQAARPRLAQLSTTYKFIAIGASTGGTEALRVLLTELPPDAPGVVIAQHMPGGFTRSFAERLDGLCQIEVREAQSGDRMQPGLALLAPGHRQLSVQRSGAEVRVVVEDGDPRSRFRPSVDHLFHSCARQLGRNAVGVILTGMGDDGARGLLAMRQAGAHTVAQDEASCVVFGMPREAIAHGGVVEVLPLERIAAAALDAAA